VIVSRVWHYPALIAVLGQERKPSFAELRHLVRRIRREMVAARSQQRVRGQVVRRLVIAALKSPAVRRGSNQ
jgi:hypothetical protein